MNNFIIFISALLLKTIFSVDGTKPLLLMSGDMMFATFVLIALLYKNAPDKKILVKALKLTVLSLAIYIYSSAFSDKSIGNAIINHIRIVLPILVYFSLIVLLNDISFSNFFYKYIPFFIPIVIILFYYGIFNLQPFYRHHKWVLPSYFQGSHTTSYVLLSTYFLFTILVVKSNLKSFYTFALCCIATIITFNYINSGLGVKSAALGLIIFVGLLIIEKLDISFVLKIFYSIFFALIVILLTESNISYDLLYDFSSGRIGMYQEKFDQLAQNNIITWLIGNGAGSDLIKSTTWFWAKDGMGAHNDFITFLVEYGLIGELILLAILLLIIKSFKRCNNKTYYLISAFLSTSLISNGIIVRPLPSYIFFTVLALANDFQSISAKLGRSKLTKHQIHL